MPGEFFYSDREELRRPPDGLVRGDVPQQVRNAVVNFLRPHKTVRQSDIWQALVTWLDMAPDLYEHRDESSNVAKLHAHLRTSAWHEFLDACSAIFRYADQFPDDNLFAPDVFRGFLNDRLIRHYSAYRMAEDGRIVEPQVALAHSGVVEDAATHASAPRKPRKPAAKATRLQKQAPTARE